MPWDYLIDKKNEGRWEIIADLIKDKVKDKVIVDVDCGIAGVVKYLKDFKFYYGNDIEPKYIEHCKNYNIPNTEFELISDDRVRVEGIDILMVLGFGCEGEHESTTLFNTFSRLVRIHSPEYIIFESAVHFEKKHQIHSTVKAFMAVKEIELIEEKGFIIKSSYPNCKNRKVFLFKNEKVSK